jgi:parvulin-like peptidyl-prolyl isomerase
MLIKYSTKLLLLCAVAALPVSCGQAESSATNAQTGGANASPRSSLYGNEVVAKGQGVEIKRSQVEDEFVRLKAQLAGQGRPIPNEHRDLIEGNILQQMIGLQLLTGKATDADKTAGKTAAEKKWDDAKARLGSDEMIDMRLKAENLTRAELLRKWTDQSTAEAVLERELKVTVSDEQARKFYEENPGRFEQPEMVRASHILFSTREGQLKELPDDKKAAKKKLAEEVLKRARAGEDFAKLVKEHSEDPGSKDKGGEYTFPRGQMVPEFEAAAFSLKPGQISDLVTTAFGYHIIKLSEQIPAKKAEYAKVADELKNGLKVQEMQKLFPDFLAKLKKEAGVEILDAKLKAAETNAAPAAAAQPAGRNLPAGHPPVTSGKK